MASSISLPLSRSLTPFFFSILPIHCKPHTLPIPTKNKRETEGDGGAAACLHKESEEPLKFAYKKGESTTHRGRNEDRKKKSDFHLHFWSVSIQGGYSLQNISNSLIKNSSSPTSPSFHVAAALLLHYASCSLTITQTTAKNKTKKETTIQNLITEPPFQLFLPTPSTKNQKQEQQIQTEKSKEKEKHTAQPSL